jgi:hypothetical protein
MVPEIHRVAPYLILAGDIGHLHDIIFADFIKYCSRTWEAVYFVPGNHEFYSTTSTYQELLNGYIRFCRSFHNVYFLQDGAVGSVEDVQIFGATMWPVVDPWKKRPKILGFQSTFASFDHFRALVRFLTTRNRSQPAIVVTHFPVTRELTSHPKYAAQSDIQRKYFANNWLNLLPEALVRDVVFVSGHTHYSFDFVRRSARFVSNQWGYPEDAITDASGYKDNVVL